MKFTPNLGFLEGFGSLSKHIFFNLLKLIPVYILIFIAYGDKFLPSPLAEASYETRTNINNVLMGTFMDKVVDNLENNKYNNKKIDRIREETEKEYRSQ